MSVSVGDQPPGITLKSKFGDDLNDIPVLNIVGFPITVADSVEDVIAIANFVTEKKGGEGAVREVCDLIIAAKDA